MNNTDDIVEMLLDAGVRNLKEFGYPKVNSKNIVTDYVYSEFFSRMLNDSYGKSPSIDSAIKKIRKQISDARKERVKT